MAPIEERALVSELHTGIGELRRNWFWFVLLGVFLVIMGMVALGAPWVASLATVAFVSAYLLISGVIEIVGAFWSLRSSGFFLHLLSGVLSLVIGVLFLRAPLDALLTLTLLVSCLFLVGGIFKIVAAVSHRFHAWVWVLLSGVIDLSLGVMIWMDWPESALWVLGLFVGISLVFRGFHWIGLGLILHRHPA
jgi:uncharacterized membrane protein HdeD (DUF308 family)